MIIYVPDSLARCMKIFNPGREGHEDFIVVHYEGSRETRSAIARYHFMEEVLIDFNTVHYYCNNGDEEDHTKIIFGG